MVAEYMTGGRVIVLARTGRATSPRAWKGGIAYVLDEAGDFPAHCNQEMVTSEN